MAKTEQKLKDRCEELIKDYGVYAKYFCIDFSKVLDPKWYEDLAEKTKDLDISILVNDVGVMPEDFVNLPPQQIFDAGIINMTLSSSRRVGT